MKRKARTYARQKPTAGSGRLFVVLRSSRSLAKAEECSPETLRSYLDVSKSLSQSFRDEEHSRVLSVREEKSPPSRLFTNEALSAVSIDYAPLALEPKIQSKLQPRTAMSLSRLSCEFKPTFITASPPRAIQRLKTRNYSPYYPKLLNSRGGDSYYQTGVERSGGKHRSKQVNGELSGRDFKQLPSIKQNKGTEDYGSGSRPVISRRRLPSVRVISVVSPAIERISLNRASFLQDIMAQGRLSSNV